MKNLMKNERMTLKEIAELLEVKHSKAMRIVEKMYIGHSFGAVRKISSRIITGNGTEKTIESYSLDKRQSMIVAARLNIRLLVRVIDRWQELEEIFNKTNAELIMSNATRLLIETCIKSNGDIGSGDSIEQLKLTK